MDDDEHVGGAVLLAAFALLALAVAFVYAPVLDAGFVDLDDRQNLVENQRWRGFSAENVAWMLGTPHMGHWHPLTWASFALDDLLGGGTPAAMHATNVALHALGAFLLFLLARRVAYALVPSAGTRVRTGAALGAAAGWALHPLRVESVAWITERRDVLSSVFLFGCVLAWMHYADSGRRRASYWLAVGLAALSLLSKAWGMTLFLVLFVVDVCVLRRRSGPAPTSWRALLLEKLPFAALGLAAGAAAIWAQGAAGGTLRSFATHGGLERVAQAVYGTCWYVSKTIAPTGLRPMVTLPDPFVPTAPLFLGCAVVVGCAIFLTIRGLRRHAAWAGGIATYLVVLAPVSGVSQAGLQLVADRYAHLATVPLFLAWAVVLLRIASRSKALAIVIGVVVPLSLAVVARERAAAWKSTETLWTSVLELDPTDTFACSSLASLRDQEAQRTADPARKRALLQEGLALARRGRPRDDWPALAFNTGVLLEHLAAEEPERRTELLEASLAEHERGFDLARAANQVDPQWHMNRAAALFQLGRFEAALPDLEAFVALRPSDPQGRRALALAWLRLGRVDAAAAEYSIASDLAPGDASIALRLARALESLGKLREARAAFARADEAARRGALLGSSELAEVREALVRLAP